MSRSRSFDIFLRSRLSERSKRWAKRFTCVSVGIPSHTPYNSPNTTCAVLYPTPGRLWRSSALSGTLPPKSDRTFCAAAITCRALFWKNVTDDISRVNCAISARAKSAGVLYFLKSGSVTRLTSLSVHCAERVTATRNWNGVAYLSSLFGLGYVRFRYATMRRARALRSLPLSMLIRSRYRTLSPHRSLAIPTDCLSSRRVWRGRNSPRQ